MHMDFLSHETLVDARGSKKPSGFAPEFTAILLSCSTSWTSASPYSTYTCTLRCSRDVCASIKHLWRGLHTGASAILLSGSTVLSQLGTKMPFNHGKAPRSWRGCLGFAHCLSCASWIPSNEVLRGTWTCFFSDDCKGLNLL